MTDQSNSKTLNPCPCCGSDKIRVFFEDAATNGVVTGHYLSHPVYKPDSKPLEAIDCEVVNLNLYEWYGSKDEAIESWNSGEAIENARKFEEEGMSGFRA